MSNGPDGSNAYFLDDSFVDGNKAAFIQGGGSLSQTLSGLTVGQHYVFQGMFRPRSTPGVPVLDVTYGSQALVTSQSLTPGSPWQPFSVGFTAGSATNTLTIASSVPGGGDGTLAIDNISVFQLDVGHVNIFNPSFESGTTYPFPGYQGQMGGWTADAGPGSYGYNYLTNNPFADNNVVPDGTTVAFIQNTRTLSQSLSGLTVGQQYLLELDYNSRDYGDDGHISVSLGGTSLLDTIVTPTGLGNPWYHLSVPWTAGSSTASLAIAGIQNGGDSSIVFDRISLQAIPEPTTSAAALLGLAALRLRRRRA